MGMKKRLIIFSALALLAAASVTALILWNREQAEKEAWNKKVTLSAEGSIVPCAKRSVTQGENTPFCESDKYCVLKVDATSVAGETTQYCASASTNQQDQYSCESVFGKWGNWNGSQQPSCNKAFTDGGRPCKDGAECEAGACLSQLDDSQIEQFNNGKDVVTRGSCPRWQLGESGYLIVNGVVDEYRE